MQRGEAEELADEDKRRLQIVQKFWEKLESKFKQMGKSFRHFDRNFDGSISYKEFTIVCEELDLRFTSDELKLLFKYIDVDESGTVGYKEFINLSDEKRRGLDPFDN